MKTKNENVMPNNGSEIDAIRLSKFFRVKKTIIFYGAISFSAVFRILPLKNLDDDRIAFHRTCSAYILVSI